MKNAGVKSKEIVETAKSRRLTGVPVRSGVKAGEAMVPGNVAGLGPGGLGKPGHPGGVGGPGRPGHPGRL